MMPAETLLIMAMASAGLPSPPSALQEQSEIIVTGARPLATKIDYRLRGAALVYCGARDRQQNASAVATICTILDTCVRGGARSKQTLSAYVEDKRARRPSPGK